MPTIRARVIRKFIRTFFNMNPRVCKDQISTTRYVEKAKFYKTPKGYSYDIHNLANSKIEILKKNGSQSDKLIYVLHGGAYISGMNDFYRSKGKKYSIAGHDATIAFLDYRLAPDNLYPCTLEDAVDGWNYLLEQGYKEENILVIGDSAGGHLTITLMLKLQELGKKLPKALICLSPWLDMTGSGESYVNNYSKDIMFGTKSEYEKSLVTEILESDMYIYFSKTDKYDPNISPVYATYHDFPPTLIIAGGDELILSDSVILADKLKASGCEVTFDVTDGMFHVYPMYELILPESRRAMKLIYDFIGKNLK